MDIVAHGIQIVEELGNAILYHVWLAYALVSKRVNYHLDAFFFKMNIYFGSRHNRVAVIVYHARLASRDMQLLTTERFDFRVFVECLVEHVEADLRSLNHIERLHDDNVYQSVAHRSLRSNIGIVAILRCVGAGNQERLVLLGSRLVFQRIRLRLILQSFSQYVFCIADRSPFATLCKLHADEGVEAHAAGAEEWMTVDDAIVEVVDLACVDYLDALLQVHRQEKMACQSVARTARQNAKGRVRMNQRTGYFIDGSVSPHSHYDVGVVVLSLCSQFRCMSCSFSQFYLVLKKLFVQS